jgi:hypothetical protein
VSAEVSAVEVRGLPRPVRVQVVFHVADDRQAHSVSAQMVDRAHEIANMPEYECDVDVTVERTEPGAAHPVDPGDAPARRGPAQI